jgi:XTP/dITP diphosphohydrolase
MNNIMKLFFLTSNKAKVKTMRRWLSSIGKVYLRRPPINQPERKDESIERIATFKIMDNKDYIKSHFVVHDSGFYLDAIPGFPGPNVNHTLSTIGIEGILEMIPMDRRSCYFKNVLAFWSPNLEKNFPKNPIRYFTSEVRGSIAIKPTENNTNEAWSDLWRIFIPYGYNSTLAEMGKKEREAFYESQNTPDKNTFVAFAKWLTNNISSLYVQARLFD